MMVDPNMDAVTYSFGGTEDYEKYMEGYILGLVEEIDEPTIGSIALFLNEEMDVVHLGRVTLDVDGIMVVESKDKMLPLPSLTNITSLPFHDAHSVLWVNPLEEE